MKRKLIVLTALVAVLGAAAAVFAFTQANAKSTAAGAIMIPYEEVPSISNPGAVGQIELRRSGPTSFDFRLQWSGLTGPPLFAHIHLGQRGVNGGVSAFLCGGSTKPACPQSTAGTVSGSIGPADVVGPSGQGIAAGEWNELTSAMIAGYTYANIHTPTNPGGELRGQIFIGS